MGGHDSLAERFETHRTHLRAVAYRMLGSLSDADDAVVVAPREHPVSVMGFTVTSGRIVAIDVLADPVRLDQLDLVAWAD